MPAINLGSTGTLPRRTGALPNDPFRGQATGRATMPFTVSALSDEDLRAAAADGSWRELAACAQTDPEAFFASAAGRYGNDFARTVCASCEVQAICLESIMSTEPASDRHGFTAGLSASQRGALFRANPGRWNPRPLRLDSLLGLSTEEAAE